MLASLYRRFQGMSGIGLRRGRTCMSRGTLLCTGKEGGEGVCQRDGVSALEVKATARFVGSKAKTNRPILQPVRGYSAIPAC